MQIVQTLETLSVNTDDCSLFRYFQDLIKKNFTKVIGNKSKTLSFFVENEIPQRRYFLKLLNYIYKKNAGLELDNLALAHFKTIKLNLEESNTLKPLIFAKIGFNKAGISISFDANHKLFISYLNQYFKNHNTSYDEKAKVYFIDFLDEQTLILVQNLASVNEHLKYCVDFTINEAQLLKYKDKMQNKANNWKFNALAKLFSNYFTTLDASPKDDLDCIRAKYLSLVKVYHPDKHINKSGIEKAYCREQFEKIQLAYDSLKNLYKNNA